MDIMVFDGNFTLVDIVDNYNSFLWTERYYDCGDFEISLYATPKIINTFQTGYFIKIKDRSGIMIVEKLDYKNDSEDGNTVIVSGRSAECILDYRDVYGYNVKANIKNDAISTFSELFSEENVPNAITESMEHGLDRFAFVDVDFQTAIEMILNETVLKPEDDRRRIKNLRYKKSTDPRFKDLRINYDKTYDDKTVYNLLREIHNIVGASFRINWNGEEDPDSYVFESYMGTDRSFTGENFDQSLILFSSSFDNLISSEYYVDQTKDYNTVVVATKFFSQGRMLDDGYTYQQVTADDKAAAKNAKNLANIQHDRLYQSVTYMYKAYSIGKFYEDFDRKETFLDLSNIYPSNNDSPYIIDYGDSFYPKSLPSDEIDQTPIGIWNEELQASVTDFFNQHRPDKSFSSELDPNIQWTFGEDYYIGDFVQVVDDYLFSYKYQVVEMIISDDSSGYAMYPTFEIVEEEEGPLDIKTSSQIIYGYLKSIPCEDGYMKQLNDNDPPEFEWTSVSVSAASQGMLASQAKKIGFGYVYNNILYG